MAGLPVWEPLREPICSHVRVGRRWCRPRMSGSSGSTRGLRSGRGGATGWLGSGAAALAMAGAATVLLPVATDSAPAPRISESRMALVAQQTRALNGVTSRLETPWQAWLRDCLLELPAESGVLQLDIDPQQRRIKLVLDTADFAAVEAVIARLEASGHFAGLRSTGHDRDSAGRLRAVVEGGLLGVDAEAFSTAAGVTP